MLWFTVTVLLVVGSCNWTPAGGQTSCSLSGPQSLSAAVLSPTTVKLTWVASCHTQQSHIYYKGTCGAYIDEGRLDTDSQEHTFDELQEGINYTFTVNQTDLSGGGVLTTGPVYARTFTTVPSGAPQSLQGMFVHPTEVSLRWREVSCIHQNGPTTGYIVWYYKTFGADRSVRQNKSVTTVGVIIDSLTPYTEYSFQVAAVNSNGTGPFSEPMTMGGPNAATWAAAGVSIAVVVVLLIVAVVQCAVMWHMQRPTTRKKSQPQRATTQTTEIPLKMCTAYGQIDRSGGEEETSIYALPR